MKRIYGLGLVAAMLISFNSIAQDNNPGTADWSPEVYRVGEKYPGYIIKQDGDTIQGYLKAQQRCSINGIGNSNQNMALFYLSEADKKPTAKYKPKDIKGYKIADKVYEAINYSGGLFKKPNFNVVVTEGAIRLYEWYATAENFNSINQQSGESWMDFDARRFETKTIVAKNPTEPIEAGILGMGFKKKMSVLVEDNAAMTEKIKNGEKGYKFINIYKVINEYNQWAENQ